MEGGTEGGRKEERGGGREEKREGRRKEGEDEIRKDGRTRASCPLSKALILAAGQPGPATLLLGAMSVSNC